MPAWIFERYGRTGGIGGEGVTNALEGGGWTAREDLLAREAIQNSVDALDRDGGERKALIRFRRRVLTGADKRAFLDHLQFNALSEHAALQQVPGRESAFMHADNLGKELELLYIEDFRTVGLGGGLQDPKRGHFYRLLFLVGEGGKAYEEGHTGGSYGYGKAVYSNNSNVATIVVHSVFSPTAQTEGHHARLLGCSFFRGYEHDGVNYTGRAWLGERAHDQPDAPMPLVDEDAHALAAVIGFAPRAAGENGTSILIVGSDRNGASLDMARLRHAIESWWWPLLVHSNLDIELWDGDELLPPPQPRRSEREDLRPFVECWLALESPDSTFYAQTFNRVKQHDIGRLVLRALAEEEVAAYVEGDDDEPDASARAPGPRKVALVRSPSMVVAYQAAGSAGKPPFVGVFRAHDDVDQALKLSEPPAHDRWDPVARRLENESDGAYFVETILRRIKEQAKGYQKRLAPPKPKPKERLTWLDRMLGEMSMDFPEHKEIAA